ncbi:MAG: hypothetical protein WAU01_13050 [Saprospiraceae bacterium]
MKIYLLLFMLLSCLAKPDKYERDSQNILKLLKNWDSIKSVGTCRKIIDIRIDKFSNNVEICQVYNEVLFSHLLFQPFEFVVYLEKNHERQSAVYQNLASQINDMIDLENIMGNLLGLQYSKKWISDQNLVAAKVLSIVSSNIPD